MKIAVACDQDGTLSTHFGRSVYFQLFEVENKKVIAEEPRRDRGACGSDLQSHHGPADSLPEDCKIMICGGMGGGAAQHFISQGVQPVVALTGSLTPRQAVEAFLEGRLEQGTVHACCHSHEEHA
jgi:predicted Fe-Mo cluster-binding NifX family protein